MSEGQVTDQGKVTAKNIDLTNCDREQAPFSNAVQPHGCMIVLEESSLRIVQLSADCGDMLGDFTLAPDGKEKSGNISLDPHSLRGRF